MPGFVCQNGYRMVLCIENKGPYRKNFHKQNEVHYSGWWDISVIENYYNIEEIDYVKGLSK